MQHFQFFGQSQAQNFKSLYTSFGCNLSIHVQLALAILGCKPGISRAFFLGLHTSSSTEKLWLGYLLLSPSFPADETNVIGSQTLSDLVRRKGTDTNKSNSKRMWFVDEDLCKLQQNWVTLSKSNQFFCEAHIVTEILRQQGIGPFRLPICLRMVGCGELDFVHKQIEEYHLKLSREPSILVAHYVLQHIEVLRDMS